MTASVASPSFDAACLDALMERAGVEILVATSKHSVQYLTGGHRSYFFDAFDAIGLSRYLPVLVYVRGAPDKAAYIGHRLERHQLDVRGVWTPTVLTGSVGVRDALDTALGHVRRAVAAPRKVAVELGFLPADAARLLGLGLPGAELVDATPILERLRARKTDAELAMLRYASEQVIAAMTAVIAGHGPGVSKATLNEALRVEETRRGLAFDYCLMSAGTSLNRAPSDQVWGPGDILSLDSGGNYRGYIGDVTRMAIQGEPDAELEDLLGEIEAIQRAAFAAIRPGSLGRGVEEAAEAVIARSPVAAQIEFVAHGMGLVTHEVPHLSTRAPAEYEPEDADLPLEPGYVVSVETTLQHPRRGFIKLEDTVAVTDSGHEIYGEGARGWNRGGTRAG